MRLVFAGTPEAALPSLAALLDSGHEIAAVVTARTRQRAGACGWPPARCAAC
jgi:methionyl-tRNA formyltransferase